MRVLNPNFVKVYTFEAFRHFCSCESALQWVVARCCFSSKFL